MFERLSGYTSEEVVGKNYRDLSCPENDKAAVADAINAQMNRGKVHSSLANIFMHINIAVNFTFY